MTIAYIYRWTQKSTGMWYEGSRTAKGCHPDDGYICSKPLVKLEIVRTPQDWVREILVTGASMYIRKLEGIRLTAVDAKNNPMSFNQDNATGKFTTTGMPAWNKGLTKITDQRVARGAQAQRGVSKGKGKMSPHKGKKHGKRKNKSSFPVWNKGLTKYNHSGMAKIAEFQNIVVSDGRHNFSKLKGIPKSEEHKQKLRKPKHAGHGAKVSESRKGKIFLPRISRLDDRKEMDIGNFCKWLKRQLGA